MSFLDIMRGFLQIAKHEGEEEKTETAHIIRLIGPCTILNKAKFE